MKSNTTRTLLLLIVATLTVSGCELIRKATYPEDFTYLETQTVTSSMQRLAISIDKIDRILQRINLIPTGNQRNSLIDELNQMVKITDTLGAGTQTTNHLLLDENIDKFRSDVITVRRSIESDQSNYYLAGKLTGSCNGCHLLRYDN